MTCLIAGRSSDDLRKSGCSRARPGNMAVTFSRVVLGARGGNPVDTLFIARKQPTGTRDCTATGAHRPGYRLLRCGEATEGVREQHELREEAGQSESRGCALIPSLLPLPRSPQET